MQLNTSTNNFLVKFGVSLKQQILEELVSFIGKLICACSNLLVHLTITLSFDFSFI
jgi:hypothetical protein